MPVVLICVILCWYPSAEQDPTMVRSLAVSACAIAAALCGGPGSFLPAGHGHVVALRRSAAMAGEPRRCLAIVILAAATLLPLKWYLGEHANRRQCRRERPSCRGHGLPPRAAIFEYEHREVRRRIVPAGPAKSLHSWRASPLHDSCRLAAKPLGTPASRRPWHVPCRRIGHGFGNRPVTRLDRLLANALQPARSAFGPRSLLRRNILWSADPASLAPPRVCCGAADSCRAVPS